MGSDQFVVRAAQVGDVNEIVDLTAEVAAEGRWIATQPGFDRRTRADGFRAVAEGHSPGFSLVAVADDRVIGHAGLFVEPYGVAELGMMVTAEWRGRGVGNALLAELLEWARAADDVHKVALQHWPHNEAAHRLYRRHGFAVEGRLHRHYRRDHGEAWDAIVMGLVVDETVPGSSIPDDGPVAPASWQR